LLNSELFDQQIGELTSTLGDTTRRGIYVSIRESAEPVTVSQIAELFNIHPNVARHHLDRLVADDYLEPTLHRPEGQKPAGAGRPAKYYKATQKEVAVEFPGRRYELLSELLARVLERVAPDDAARAAEEVGREYGAQLAAEVGLPDDLGYETAIQAVAQAMVGVGFQTAVSTDDKLVTRFCPFGSTAVSHPKVVCKIDEGIVSGLMGAITGSTGWSTAPHEKVGDDCIIDV
jgi:predicted ArsR family transcriptional regulator